MLYQILSFDDLLILGAFVFGLLFLNALRKKYPAPPREEYPWPYEDNGEDDDNWIDHDYHDYHVHSDDCDHHEFHDDCDHD